MITAHDTHSPVIGAHAVFGRVLVGVDGSYEAAEAVRQAGELAEGEMTLLAVYDAVPAFLATTGATPPSCLDDDVQRELADDVLRRARAERGDRPVTARLAKGCPWGELIREVERDRDTLVAVGSHGTSRARGMIMGSTATELIHRAPCSVLVARDVGAGFPKSIVVGVDGSPESAAAFAAARHLAERFDAKMWSVVAHGGKGVAAELAATIAGDRREDLLDEPVTALVAAAADADLLVVGSRGLHGLGWLGSVSGRVAHKAHSSVLIVREPGWQRVARELERRD